MCDDAAMTSQPGFSGDCEQFPQVTRSLFTNATYVFTVLSAVSEWMMVSGFAVFGPKYIENQFSMPAATAGVLFGEFIKQAQHICITFVQCRRRWSNIVQMSYKCFVFAGKVKRYCLFQCKAKVSSFLLVK